MIMQNKINNQEKITNLLYSNTVIGQNSYVGVIRTILISHYI